MMFPSIAPAEILDADQDVPDTLIDRLRFQRSSSKLDLSLCNITNVPIQSILVYYGCQPYSLDVSYNCIQYISPRFPIDLGHIAKLDLSWNQIKRLPDNFGDMSGLIYLDLHKNKLQALPLSMGKMKRLQYLRVSENPFRAPLKDFLGQKDRDVSGIALADLVVTFLREVAAVHDEPSASERTSDLSLSLSRTRSSKVHYTKRSSKCGVWMGNEPKSSSSDEGPGPTEETLVHNDENNNQVESSVLSSADNPGESESSTFPPVLVNLIKFLVISGIWIAILPLLIAYFTDATYLENLVSDCPFWKNIWTNYYKGVHEQAVQVIGLFPRFSTWFLRKPPPEVGTIRKLWDGTLRLFTLSK